VNHFQISNHILTTTIQNSTSLPSTSHRLPSKTNWREKRRTPGGGPNKRLNML